MISSHTARRSFCTNEYLKGTPALTIMKVSGHKTESSFLKYIKISSKEHAEKMKQLWEGRESNLKAV
jgi:integrase